MSTRQLVDVQHQHQTHQVEEWWYQTKVKMRTQKAFSAHAHKVATPFLLLVYVQPGSI